MSIDYSEFQSQWIELAKRFGLQLEVPHEISLGERNLLVPVLLKKFGAVRGMLLVTDYEVVRGDAEQLVAMGYGFSCLSEPNGEAVSDEPPVEMLTEWGWAGPGDPPKWYK